MAANPRFSDSFPIPDLETWLARATKDLPGRSLDDLGWRIDDDTPLSPLATRADREGLPHLADAPRSWLGAAEPWRIRELVVGARPADAADQAEQALADGADEVEFCFDDLARDGREPGDDGDLPGASGIAIHTLDAFRRATSSVDLATTTIGLSAGEGAPAALSMLRSIADERGVDASKLTGDVDLDPIAKLTQRQAAIDSDDAEVVVSRFANIESVFSETHAIAAHCREHCPGIRPIAIDLQGYHLSGASAANELAAGLATLAETGRQLTQRGMTTSAVAASLTIRTQVSHEVLIEVSKLRALRLLVARVLAAFGAGEHAGTPPLHVVTSGRSRAYRFDLNTNLLRTSLAGFAAVVGGCDVLSIVPIDEDPHMQDDSMRRTARHQQVLLRTEAMLDVVRDPSGGAFAIEQMTDRIARAAWTEFRAIEARGGLIAALQDGSLFQTITADAETRTRDFATRRRTMIGINKFVDAELDDTTDAGRQEVTVEDLNQLAAEHADYLRGRPAWTPDPSGDPITAGTSAARSGATTGEITRARWPEDDAFRHRFLPIALLDGDEFEELRDANHDTPIRVRLAALGTPTKTVRARLDLARSVLQAGGFAISEPEARPTDSTLPAAAQGASWAAGVDAVVVACGDQSDAIVDLLAAIPCKVAVIAPPIRELAEHPITFWQNGETDWIDALTDLLGAGAQA